MKSDKGDNVITRIDMLRKKVEERGYDAFLVADEMNICYLTNIPMTQGFCSGPYLLVRPSGEQVLYVPSDFSGAAQEIAGNKCDIKAPDVGEPSLSLVVADLAPMKLKRIGFDTLLADIYLRLSETLKATRFIPDAAAMWDLRMIKSEEEIQNVRKAAKIADEGQKTAASVVRPGILEYEVAAEVEHTMRKLGSEDEGHRTMVSSGPRAILGVGSGFATDRRIAEGELVLVDSAATFKGYRTDLARTYVAGKPSLKQKEMYDLVLNAWSAAFSCVRSGAVTGEVDRAARKVLGQYERYFIHEVGHGLGLSFPEPPIMIKNSRDILKENMVVTVEPAVYIDGIGGILVEDTTLVVRDGAERLTAPPLEWNR